VAGECRGDGTTAEGSRGAGLRVTAARVAPLRTDRDGPRFGVGATASGVRDGVGLSRFKPCVRPLRRPTATGPVRRVQPPGSPARRKGRVGDHQVVWQSCGVITHVGLDCAIGEAPGPASPGDQGLSIDEAEVVSWGLRP
jgi:hypothetical protein